MWSGGAGSELGGGGLCLLSWFTDAQVDMEESGPCQFFLFSAFIILG